jgi:hypothetical protein
MSVFKLSKIAASAIAGALCLSLLGVVGCSSTSQSSSSVSAGESSAQTSATTSKQYMSNMNQKAADLNDRLAAFVDAVSREDTVAMRIQADSAQEIIDQMTALEAPEEISQIKADYDAGVAKLKEAMDSYINLYTEIAQAKSDGGYDASSYAQKLADVQAAYNEGIELIKKADSDAASLS